MVLRYLLLLAVAVVIHGFNTTFSTEVTADPGRPTNTLEATEGILPTSETNPESRENGDADVLHVRAVEAEDGSWAFIVTVQHEDTGWEDYADGWDVITLDGNVLKTDPTAQFTRTLAHPHVDEQPFTRSQAGITIPEGTEQVIVRAHDLLDGYGGATVMVNFNQSEGEHYTLERYSISD